MAPFGILRSRKCGHTDGRRQAQSFEVVAKAAGLDWAKVAGLEREEVS